MITIKKISENLTLIVGVLIFSAVIRLKLLYNNFNLDILSYMDFTEILLSNFEMFFLIGTGLIIIAIPTYWYKIKQEKKGLLINEANIVDKADSSIYNAFIGSIFLIGNIKLNPLNWNICWVIIDLILLLSILTWIIVPILTLTEKEIERLNEIKRTRLLYLKVNLIIGFMCATYFCTIIESMFFYETRHKISFTYKNEIVKSSYRNLFLGETKNFIFMYDILNDSASIFNKEGIDKISIKVN